MQDLEVCFGETRYKLIKNHKHFLKKAPSWIFDRVPNVSKIMLLLYIYLGHNFEFRSLRFIWNHVCGYPETYLGSYEKIYDEVFLPDLNKFEQIAPNFSKSFVRFTWNLLFIVLTRAFMIALFFHNTDLSCCLTYCLA